MDCDVFVKSTNKAAVNIFHGLVFCRIDHRAAILECMCFTLETIIAA